MKNLIKNFYKNNFVYSTKEKLSKLTILVIAILNIIVYLILLEGLSFQTNFVNSPIQVYSCSDIVKSNINDFNSFIYKNQNRRVDINSIEDNRCKEIKTKFEAIKNQIAIFELQKQDKELLKNEQKTLNDLDYIRENYNTALFEKMAIQTSDKSILKDDINSENIKQKYDLLQKLAEELKEQRESLRKNFENSKVVEELSSYQNSIKDSYLEDEKKAYRVYYYKVELIKLLFLAPLLLLFFYLMKKYLKDEKYTLYIVFKNIFVVVLLPTLYTVFMVIYKFLPKIFIEKVIEFFYNLEIPFVVYYILIIVFVLFFTFLILKIQKRFKEQSISKITKIDYFNKNLCSSCGNRVDFSLMNFCPNCQNRLKIECKSCNNLTIFGLSFCQNCGMKSEDKF